MYVCMYGSEHVCKHENMQVCMHEYILINYSLFNSNFILSLLSTTYCIKER